MILSNLYNIVDDRVQDIRFEKALIKNLGNGSTLQPAETEPHLSFENAVVIPGLINSHDHLDFNLFPQIGNRKYKNYTEWGKDIHANNRSQIDQIMKVPKSLRVQWGIYKNLLNGVTTVVNHGERLKVDEELISVFQDCYSLHSIHFENNWKYKLNRLFARKGSYVIHVGEGTDAEASEEIDRLTKWNLFRRKLVGIHGVAMSEKQSALFHALVWCPVSNFFLLNSTAPVNQLKRYTDILFGTDSTLTADWNIWEQLRFARKTKLLTDTSLLNAVTAIAAVAWGFNSGVLAPGKSADIVVAKKKECTEGTDCFFGLDPEMILMVIHQGHIRLFDGSMKADIEAAGFDTSCYSSINIGNAQKFVQGDLPALAAEIKKLSPGIQLPIPV